MFKASETHISRLYRIGPYTLYTPINYYVGLTVGPIIGLQITSLNSTNFELKRKLLGNKMIRKRYRPSSEPSRILFHRKINSRILRLCTLFCHIIEFISSCFAIGLVHGVKSRTKVFHLTQEMSVKKSLEIIKNNGNKENY